MTALIIGAAVAWTIVVYLFGANNPPKSVARKVAKKYGI